MCFTPKTKTKEISFFLLFRREDPQLHKLIPLTMSVKKVNHNFPSSGENSDPTCVVLPVEDEDMSGLPRACFKLDKYGFFIDLVKLVHEGGEQLIGFQVSQDQVQIQTYLDAGSALLCVRLCASNHPATRPSPFCSSVSGSLLRRVVCVQHGKDEDEMEEKNPTLANNSSAGTLPPADLTSSFIAQFDVVGLIKLLKVRPKQADSMYLMFLTNRIRIGYWSKGRVIQEDELVESTSAQMEDVYDLVGVVNDEGEPVQNGTEDQSLLEEMSGVVLRETTKKLSESLATSTVEHRVHIRAEPSRLVFTSKPTGGCTRSRKMYYVEKYDVFRSVAKSPDLVFMPQMMKLMYIFWEVVTKATGGAGMCKHSSSEFFWKSVHYNKQSGEFFTFVVTTCEEEAR